MGFAFFITYLILFQVVNAENDKDEFLPNEGQFITGDHDGDYVDHGDIMFRKGEEKDIFGTGANDNILTGPMKDAIKNEAKRWKLPVPYVIESSLSSSGRKAVMDAFEEYRKKTCITFRPKSSSDRDYISIKQSSGCWSYVGRTGGKQSLSLGNGCHYRKTAVHELMHALGFWHEQSRPDRDGYVRINLENVLPAMLHNFNKKKASDVTDFGHPYDYISVMHYRKKAFSANGKDTITVIGDPNQKLGQPFIGGGLSTIDARQLNAMYCKDVVPTPTPTRTTTRRPTITRRRRIPISRRRIPISRRRIPICRRKIPISRRRIPISRRRIPISRRRIRISRRRIPISRRRVPISRRRIPILRRRVPIFRRRIRISRRRIPISRRRVPISRRRVPISRRRIPISRRRVPIYRRRIRISRRRVPIYRRRIPISRRRVPISRRQIPISRRRVPIYRRRIRISRRRTRNSRRRIRISRRRVPISRRRIIRRVSVRRIGKDVSSSFEKEDDQNKKVPNNLRRIMDNNFPDTEELPSKEVDNGMVQNDAENDVKNDGESTDEFKEGRKNIKMDDNGNNEEIQGLLDDQNIGENLNGDDEDIEENLDDDDENDDDENEDDGNDDDENGDDENDDNGNDEDGNEDDKNDDDGNDDDGNEGIDELLNNDDEEETDENAIDDNVDEDIADIINDVDDEQKILKTQTRMMIKKVV